MVCWLHIRAASVATLLFFAATGAVQTDSSPADFSLVENRVADSIVRIKGVLPAPKGAAGFRAEDAVVSSAGFFVGTNGEVLTSLFAIAGCCDISVACPDGRSATAEVVAVDQPSGLALVKADLPATIPFETSHRLPDPGSWLVLAAVEKDGPRVLASLLPARVTDERASVRLQSTEWHGLMVAALGPGDCSAAAPLLDDRGRLTAVVLALRPVGLRGHDCIALPTARLEPILARLKKGESRRLGWLGVSFLKEPDRPEGVRVDTVLEGSPAHVAGIRPGDVLLQMDAQTIDSPEALARLVTRAQPGRAVAVQFLRSGEIRAVKVKLGTRPLIISTGPRRAGERRPRRSRATSQKPMLRELLEENRRLRRRTQELEARLQQLEQVQKQFGKPSHGSSELR